MPVSAAHRLGRLRRHVASRVFACWFIVLILVPFTAPFPTFHLQKSSPHQTNDALPKEVKDKIGSDDSVALVVARSNLSRVEERSSRTSASRHRSSQHTPLQHAVLRI